MFCLRAPAREWRLEGAPLAGRGFRMSGYAAQGGRLRRPPSQGGARQRSPLCPGRRPRSVGAAPVLRGCCGLLRPGGGGAVGASAGARAAPAIPSDRAPSAPAPWPCALAAPRGAVPPSLPGCRERQRGSGSGEASQGAQDVPGRARNRSPAALCKVRLDKIRQGLVESDKPEQCHPLTRGGDRGILRVTNGAATASNIGMPPSLRAWCIYRGRRA